MLQSLQFVLVILNVIANVFVGQMEIMEVRKSAEGIYKLKSKFN